MVINQEKRCPKCGETKSTDEFYICNRSKNRSKDGLRTYCKKCAKELQKNSNYRPDPQKRREAAIRYRELNSEKLKENHKKHCLKNYKKILERHKKWKAKIHMTLDDSYIKEYLRFRFKIDNSQITTEMIEQQKISIMMYRIKRKALKISNNKI